MKRARSIFIAFALLLLSCNFISNGLNPEPTPTDSETVSNVDCPDPQPTKEDIDRALQYSDNYFSSPDWKMSYAVTDNRTSVTWKNDELGALANFDDVIFCGVTNKALDDYYTEEVFDVIFQYYDGHEYQKECQSKDLRLYEFKVQSQGFDYNAEFWVEILDENHTRESLLVFPIADVDNFESYSEKIMPELPSCE